VPSRNKPVDSASELLGLVRVDGTLDLADHDPGETFGWIKETAKVALSAEVERMAALQKILHAEGRRSVLVVLQAMDAGGKDGTLRDVFTGLNPSGLAVSSFGVPTEEELAHDFLWRIHRHAPRAGQIAVFNRSHYEDVLVVRVKELVPRSVWKQRYAQICNFEQLLVDEGTTIVKLFLHISNEKQRERLQDRVDSPDERWKFRLGDLDDRALWPKFMEAYRDALANTSSADAPWYVVPGDRKWARNLAVARIMRHTLERIDPQYPKPEEGIEGIVVT
jgi:PPK2 family polyphosphate:nucleotide phosphotransferase